MARTMRQADAAEISMCCRAGASSAGDAVAPARQIKSGSKRIGMKRSEWSQPTSNDAAYRRAGGRARYNLKRFDVAFKRRQSAAAAQTQSAPARRSGASGAAARRVESHDMQRRCAASQE